MKVLVTGAAGFVGSHLCDALVARGDEVVGLDNFNDYYSPARKHANVAEVSKRPAFTMLKDDLRDHDRMLEVVATHKPDAIAHLGAMGSVRYSVTHPDLYVQVNIAGTANMLEAAWRAGVSRFVFASTSSVYGQTTKIPFVETDPTDRPLAPYPASKKCGEVLGHAYHNMHGMKFTGLRFFNVYGPRGRPDMMPYIVLDSLLNDKEITLYDGGDMRRDWTYVDDIVAGVMAAIDRPFDYEIINLGRGEPQLMTDFMHIMQEITGRTARVKVVPAPASEPKVTFANVDRARELLGYQPKVSLPEGLQAFKSWFGKEVGGIR